MRQSIGEGVRGGLKAKIKGFRIELTLWMDCGKVGERLKERKNHDYY